jgi:hypothetical protein
MPTFITSLLVIGILCLLLAFDGLRRLLSLLPGISRAASPNHRKAALIGSAEIAIAFVVVVASFLVLLTQPLFGPSLLSTRSAVVEYLRENRPSLEITDFSFAESTLHKHAYVVRAGSPSHMVNLLVTFDPESKQIIEIKEENP